MAERGLPCESCGRQTLHKRREPNHILWAILTLFSCGFFAIVWIIDSATSQNAPWLCMTCGSAVVPIKAQTRSATAPGPRPALLGSTIGRIALAVGGLFVACIVAVLIMIFIQVRREAADADYWRSVPTSAPTPGSGNPTHDKIRAMGAKDRELALAAYVRAAGHDCASALSATYGDLGADSLATWDVSCPDGGKYSVTIKSDAAGSATVAVASGKK